MKQEVSILNIPQPISDLQLRIFFLFYSFFYDEYSFKGFDFTCQSHTTDIPYLHHILSLLEGGGWGENTGGHAMGSWSSAVPPMGALLGLCGLLERQVTSPQLLVQEENTTNTP